MILMFIYGISIGFIIACLCIGYDIKHGNIDGAE